MSKISVDDQGMAPEAPKGDREKRWGAYVDNYAKANPVKFASKSANHEFDKIPESFK